MATKLTDTGVEFPGNGETPVEQSKAIKNVEGNEADSTGKITLSTVSGKTLDERLTEIEELGSGGGAVYLEQNTFGTNNYMFKDSYWWGGESVYSYSSASSTQQTAIENLERGNVLNLSSPNSSEYYHVSSVDSASKRITLIRGTFNDRSGQNLTIDDAENGTFSAVNLTHVSSVTPAVTTGSWLQIEAGSNYSGSTISTTNGIGFAPMNLSTLPSEATHILFRVTSETSGHLIIYNREHFLTRSSSSPILESEKVHQVDVESSGSQSSSDEFWVPNNSFLQFWLTGSGTAHLYPVAYAVMDLSKVNLDGASIPAVNALSDEIIDLQNQVNSNDADISALQTDVSNLEDDVLVLQQGGGGGGQPALYAPPQTLFLDRSKINFWVESAWNGAFHGPIGNEYLQNYIPYPGNTAQFGIFDVSEFENFFDNHGDKYKLTFYSGNHNNLTAQYSEVIISDLASHFDVANNQSSDLSYHITGGFLTNYRLLFKNNDLILFSDKETSVTYRIDMHLNAFGGGVSSLNSKTGDLTVSAGTGIGVTPTTDGLQISNSGVTSVNGSTGAVDLSNTYYTQTEVNNIVSSSGGSNVEIFYASGNWTKPAGVTRLEIILVGGGAAGGLQYAYGTSGSLYITPMHGGDTSITFPDGSYVAYGGNAKFKPGVTYLSDGVEELIHHGESGFLGKPPRTYPANHQSTLPTGVQDGHGSYVYGGGFYPGGDSSNPDGDPYGWSGGAAMIPDTYYVVGGDGGGSAYATLGGSGHDQGGYNGYSGNGNIGGGAGGGRHDNQFQAYYGPGGGGAGAGGGGLYLSGPGGGAGQILEFDKIVPSASQTYSIVIGAGGDAVTGLSGTKPHCVGGGGGQGIVIIKY